MCVLCVEILLRGFVFVVTEMRKAQMVRSEKLSDCFRKKK